MVAPSLFNIILNTIINTLKVYTVIVHFPTENTVYFLLKIVMLKNSW